MINRTVPPPIVDPVNFNLQLKPCEKHLLSNGVEVYAINAGAEEVMSLEWVFFAGNSFEEQNLVAATANFLLKNGTTRKSAFEINEYFDYYGSYLNRSCFNETAVLSLHTLTKHLDHLLPVVREIFTEANMPQEELDIYRQNMKQRLKVNLQKSDFVAGRLIDAYLYGENHPYGKYSTEEDFNKLDRETVLSFYKKYYQQGRFIIFAAGKLPKNLIPLLNNYFGDLPVQSVTVPLILKQPATEKKYRVINDPNGAQGAIRMARPFPDRHHPDFQKALVLNTVLGGFFGSRLMANIREDKGYTYGIHSFIQNHIDETAWLISTEAGRDVSEATINEVYKELKSLREDPIDQEELSLVRNYMMGSLLGELDGPFQLISRWKNIILNGLDENYFNRSVEIIKTVSAQDLQQLAQKYLQAEDFYELVVV